MLHRLILKVTKFQLPPPERLSTVVKNILPSCQTGLTDPQKMALIILEVLKSQSLVKKC